MIAKLQRLHRKKGFTLTELIIVVAIIAAIIACVAAFSRPVQDMVRTTSASSDAININKIIGDYIEGRLEFASYISVIYAVDSESSTTLINKMMDEAAEGLAAEKLQGGGGQAGALIFKFMPDTTDTPHKSTYKIFDVPFGYNATTKKATGDYPLPAAKEAQYSVFADDFYGSGTQRMILPPTAVKSGETRSNVSMTIDICSYKVDHLYDTLYIKDVTLRDYYKYKEGTLTTNPLEDLLNIKTGPTDPVSFRLNNYKKAKFGSGNDYGAGSGSNCHDVVIFYYVPKYSI